MYYQNSDAHPEDEELESLMNRTENVENYSQSFSNNNNQSSKYLNVGKLSLLVVSLLSVLFLVVNNIRGDNGSKKM